MKKFKKLMAGFAVVVTLLTTISGAHALVAIDTSTRKWEKGVGTTLYVYYWQYSNYWHKTKRHYANAMMNDKYSGRVYTNKNKWAKASSPGSWGGYSTNHSYYGDE
jgi:lactococcin 972 family bacteriocin